MIVPNWLKAGSRPSKADLSRLTPIMRNWVKLFAARKSLGEEDCLKIIYIELTGAKRPEMIGRVKVWHDKLRSERENKELWAIQPDAPIAGQSGRKS